MKCGFELDKKFDECRVELGFGPGNALAVHRDVGLTREGELADRCLVVHPRCVD